MTTLLLWGRYLLPGCLLVAAAFAMWAAIANRD
jgi:hypothetical protein